MPFINERLEANRESIEQNRAASGPVRASRFRFEPDAVMSRLRENIVGQDDALTAMESMLVRVKADIGEENRPLSVHLFLGPTGVGKTETVRLIAEAIHGSRDGLCRIDMNTLAQEHYTAALTGAPPGYVGSKEGYSLFDLDKVQGSFSKPGIVLFDEIEKASREVVRALLNVLDTGRLMFPSGNREIDFSNTLIFMTSNAGALDAEAHQQRYQKGWRRWLGLSAGEGGYLRDVALRRHFDPEFLNRIDQILTFNSLADNWLEALLDIELVGLNRRLGKKHAVLSLSTKLRGELCCGYDARYGAREMLRAFRQRLEPAVARALLAHPDCQRFEADAQNGAVTVHQYVE
ncbi:MULTISPECIES: AAA family ATPase [Marinobacter]|jgi:ATP-dependent Clp protease ATP-binding subunit ClpA|uniref:C-terminal, D2-small domain-containing protein, of ClpB protein n=1 Tax=Marinobacter salarius TaxID=1420917 RepID=A0ABY1FSG5_9GAMM|nr:MULTISPECIES: AAA family ATPase [Marinobacter]KXJ46541.1 MAG: AAA family ATPase [Marinobacter sp. Hex_13]MCZ4286891.1 AAA family ATPase [Marinobacter salarius]SFL99887.1 C-terminal, D2-small domain-containing protein, of ClpB protein [Marinobacter salarius]|tara:strand:- start:2666 stop:3709 length:1044 start_codon:yes stop_codon:yes gene_type:complete